MRALLALLLVTGCGFTVPALGSSGDGSIDAVPDVDGSVLPIDAPGTMACPWPYMTQYITPCPIVAGVELDLTNGDYRFDTGTGILSKAFPQPIEIPVDSDLVGAYRVIRTIRFRIAAGANLRVIGTVPLIVISTYTISIEGRLDVASKRTQTGFATGAGADPALCGLQPAAGAGMTCAQHGGSGGGGGGFGGAGGAGGEGGDGRDCGAGVLGLPGGPGGGALVGRPAILRGGCPGGDGAETTAGGGLGPRGHGGGAVALVARDQLVVTGVIQAGGSMGRGGNNSRGGGGGGGSGGMVVLEASSISLASSARIVANGGSGGGGADGSDGADGADADETASGVLGGQGDGNTASDGGNGGASVAATSAGIADRGGGGGGGGVGIIYFNASNLSVVSGAIVSPPRSP